LGPRLTMNGKSLTLALSNPSTSSNRRGKAIVQVLPPPPPKKKGKKGSKKNKIRGLPSVPPGLTSERYHYAASLHNPFGIRGARIPDARVVPTAVCSSVLRTSITAFPSPGTGTSPAQNGYLCGVAVKLGNLIPGGTAPIFIGRPSTSGLDFTSAGLDWPNKDALLSAAAEIRLVSAGLAIYPTTSSLNNAGRISLIQFSNDNLVPTSDVSVTQWNTSYPFQKICPVATNEVCCVSFRPKDNEQFAFQLPGTSVGPTGLAFGGLGAFISGASLGESFEVVVVANWELIPATPFTGILETNVSMYDVKALEVAFNTCQGSDMFVSYPSSVYSTTNSMFSDSSDSYNIWGRLPTIESLTHKIEGAKSLTNSLLSFGAMGLNAWRYFGAGGGGNNLLGYNRTPQVTML
jgi:hypothetical protein